MFKGLFWYKILKCVKSVNNCEIMNTNIELDEQ